MTHNHYAMIHNDPQWPIACVRNEEWVEKSMYSKNQSYNL